MPHYDCSVGLQKKLGINEDSVVSASLKGMGTFAKPLAGKEREIFQALVDVDFARFKQIVRSGRAKFEKDPARLDKLATGEVFAAEQAVDNKLVDKIGFLEDAVDRAIELAKLNKDQVKVVRYKPEVSLASIFLGSEGPGRSELRYSHLAGAVLSAGVLPLLLAAGDRREVAAVRTPHAPREAAPTKPRAEREEYKSAYRPALPPFSGCFQPGGKVWRSGRRGDSAGCISSRYISRNAAAFRLPAD